MPRSLCRITGPQPSQARGYLDSPQLWDGASGERSRTLVPMSRDLTAQRVQRDLEVIARAGLATEDFLAEAIASLGRAVPHVGACVAHLDPSTRLNTGAH